MSSDPPPNWYTIMAERAEKHAVNLEYSMPSHLVIEMLINRLDYYTLQIKAQKEMLP